MKYSILIQTFLFAHFSIAGYVIEDEYNPSNFVDGFTAFTDADPTQGFVKFLDMGTAQSTNLLKTTPDSVILGVDSTSVTPAGRPSLRLQSKKSYTTGLIIADLAHMPGSICGTWPAFWTIGPDWPNNGEIDIIEGVNSQSANSMTLHTAPGCAIAKNGAFQGQVKSSNCDINAPGQGQNVGCGISATGPNTYGDDFNNVGGGVYATEWTPQAISIWHFQRSAIPADISSGNPSPSSWGQPSAQFQGSCDINKSFSNQSIIFDTTFCGQWAGQEAVWQADPVCSKKAATCQDYVQNNPADFAQAFWEINSVKVYTLSDGFIGSNPLPPVSSSSPSPSSSPLPVPPASSAPPAPPAPAASSAPPAPPAAVSSSAPVPSVPTPPAPPAPPASDGNPAPTGIPGIFTGPKMPGGFKPHITFQGVRPTNEALTAKQHLKTLRGRHFQHLAAHQRRGGHRHI